MLEIGKGQCVSVIIRFEGQELDADLRRINNARGNLQFRYERQEHQHLRDYFSKLAENSQSKDGCVIEVVENGRGIFQVAPIAGFENNEPRLTIYRPVLHMFGRCKVDNSPEFNEIVEAVSSVPFAPDHNQKEYNLRIYEELRERQWLSEESVHDEIGLKCDFRKCGIWLEVEFGNARSYYQDYIKFLIAARYRKYDYGILLCPTASFAGYLCELGRQRARLKTGRTAQASYSGMMTYEKAVRELPCLEHIVRERVVVAGLDVRDMFLEKATTVRTGL